MQLKSKLSRTVSLLISFLLLAWAGQSQMITGVWTGKINKQKVEVKIIQQGDSLRGTSYYFESPGHFRRYSIRGYFDASTNEAVWWDDQLLEEKPSRAAGPGKVPLLARADFNCPGDGRMMLDGKAGRKDGDPRADLHLDKTGSGQFADEWDYIIDNYLVGGNDPDIIDSIGALAFQPMPIPVISEEPKMITQSRPVTRQDPPAKMVSIPPVVTVTPVSIEQKFVTRKKVLVTEIPVTGDSIELRFYDNAEIDGDSISLFLNDRLIFQHIRLLGSAYTIKLAVNQLSENSELTMVAENLGSIPPNTSYMVAIVGDKRYEARLESTEGSSAMVRFKK